jgi:hypothetical protein
MLKMKNQPRSIPWLVLQHLLIKRTLVLLLLVVLSSLIVSPLQAVDNLGLRIDVLPNSNSDKSEPYSQNRRLWLVTSEAQPTTRTIRITSSVKNSQLISLEIAAARKVGGVTELDMENKSEIAPWTKFSKSSFVLPAFGQTDIQITIDPPSDLKDYSQNAFLIVKSGATSGPKIDKSRTTAVLASQFQYATPVFYGVGNIENLMSIQIKDVDTYIDENGKYAEVEILNNGVGPVEINGDIQFTNLDFQTTNVGPLLFALPPLQPGKTGFGVLRLPEQMVAGKWKIFVQAYVGSYGEAVVITKDLSFDYKRTSQLPRLLLFLGSLLALVALLLLQRKLKTRPESADSEPRPKVSTLQRLSMLRRKKTAPKPVSALEDPDFIEWLDSLNRRTAKAKVAKKTTRPSPKKQVIKKPVKSVTSKSAATKKAVTRKATPKKKATKKAALKRK